MFLNKRPPPFKSKFSTLSKKCLRATFSKGFSKLEKLGKKFVN